MSKKQKLDIVIPVYNNSDILASSIEKQMEFYKKNLNSYNWKIVVMNNASTDNTLEIAKELSKKHSRVKVMHTDKQGRGHALRLAWEESNAELLSYMDVDLATEISAFPSLIEGLQENHLCVGSKYIPNAKTKRNWMRLTFSRVFNVLNRIIFKAQFTDAQCGFKAIKKEAAMILLPHVQDNFWFFDTELLVLAQKKGFRIKEIPVHWRELGMGTTSGVKLLKTAKSFAKKMIELRRRVK